MRREHNLSESEYQKRIKEAYSEVEINYEENTIVLKGGQICGENRNNYKTETLTGMMAFFIFWVMIYLWKYYDSYEYITPFTVVTLIYYYIEAFAIAKLPNELK